MDSTRNELLTPREVGELFRVSPKTVSYWAKEGKLRSIRTLGGHRRFRRADLDLLLEVRGENASGPQVGIGPVR